MRLQQGNVGTAGVEPQPRDRGKSGLSKRLDAPYQAVSQKCSKPHVYQTFAAVQLGYTPRRKSEIEADPTVRAVCNRRVLNQMLVGAEADRTWELMTIPPQFADDTVYRCIFGKGLRTGTLKVSG